MNNMKKKLTLKEVEQEIIGFEPSRALEYLNLSLKYVNYNI